MQIDITETHNGKFDYILLPSWLKKKIIIDVMKQTGVKIENIPARLGNKYSLEVVRALLNASPETNDARLNDILNAVVPYGTKTEIVFNVKMGK